MTKLKGTIANIEMKPKKVVARIFFEPRDIWIGVYWNIPYEYGSRHRYLNLYICILPMLPIHVKIRLDEKVEDEDDG